MIELNVSLYNLLETLDKVKRNYLSNGVKHLIIHRKKSIKMLKFSEALLLKMTITYVKGDGDWLRFKYALEICLI